MIYEDIKLKNNVWMNDFKQYSKKKRQISFVINIYWLNSLNLSYWC